MDPITIETVPPAGTLLSLTVRRGQSDPRTQQRVMQPACFRVRVEEPSTQDPPGFIRLGGQPPESMDNGFIRAMPIDAFNHDWRPHVVAVYGPPSPSTPPTPPATAGEGDS
ncbi:MAG: hypothetical protein BWX88_05303 [Planctomycetes bacterium ADurb.Bin126]|nr:MAG: hypothetical protein BWX88_05303 [Planctomycetes bacterium ADurb.Bin126]HOD84616.1 hypothetical protein [Phycisphaerae bacterium]